MIDGNSSDRYILEMGLEYPDELHEMDNGYPLALEKHKIIYDMLSEYCSDIAHNYKIKIGNVNKLVPNLGNKTKLCTLLWKSSVIFIIRNEID